MPEEGLWISTDEAADVAGSIRNQFVHFEPRGWSIEVSGIPEIAKLISRIILEMVSMGYAFRHQDSDQLEELKGNLQTLASREWLT